MKSLPIFSLIFVLVAASVGLAVEEANINVGVIIDSSSWSGKIAKTALKLAVDDVKNQSQILSGTQMFLHLREAQTPLQTASAAVDLLANEVVALIEIQTSEATPFVSDLAEAANVPILSLSFSGPAISKQRFPYFVRMAHEDRIQMKAIAALVNNYGWRSIALLHSDHDFGCSAMSSLRDALGNLDSEIVYTSMIPSTAQKKTVREELYKLNTIKSSVFVVHTPCNLAMTIFMEAQKMGMMGPGYVWITTQEFTIVWDYVVNASTISSMQGLLGVKTHIPNSEQLKDFSERWERQFRLDNPNNKNIELNTYGLLAYDSVLMIARAIGKIGRNARLSFLKPSTPLAVIETTKIKVFQQGRELLQEIFSTDFGGLSGPVKFHNGEMNGYTYEIVNMVGKSYQIVGYWPYNSSKLYKTPYFGNEGLRSVIWPGGVSTVPRDWVIPKRLKIAVPVTGWDKFINVFVNTDSNETTFSGFIIDVFEAVVKRLDYQLLYDFVPLYWKNDTYDDLIRQVYLKLYDAAVGDVTITAERSVMVDFTQPFTETGLVMVARTAVMEEVNDGWTFLQPFTPALWATTAVFVLYTGLVVWLLEHKINPDFRGSSVYQVVTVLWFAFSAVFYAHQERIRNSLSRIVVVVWVFVAFVLTSSYTANLSSRQTAEQIAPHVGSYLRDNLGIAKKQLDQISPRVYEEALAKGGKNGGVDGVIDEIPYVRAFLSSRCGYSIVGHPYRSGGFGFVFQKASPLVQDFSRGILNLSNSGEIQEMDDKYFKTSNNTCSNFAKYSRLDVRSFQGLYLVTGMVSSLAVIIFLSQALYNFTKSTTHLGQEICWLEYIKSFVRYLYQE